MPASRALVIKALCVLEEARLQAKSGAVAPGFGLRFALAWLYTVGDRRDQWFDRQPYEDFWRVATQRSATYRGVNDGVEGYGRSVALTTAMNAIARAAGVELDVPVLEELARLTRRLTRQTGPSSRAPDPSGFSDDTSAKPQKSAVSKKLGHDNRTGTCPNPSSAPSFSHERPAPTFEDAPETALIRASDAPKSL